MVTSKITNSQGLQLSVVDLGIQCLLNRCSLLPAGRALRAWLAGPKNILHLLHLCIFVHHAQQLRHIHCCHVTYFSWIWQFRQLLCVAIMSSLTSLRCVLRTRDNVDARLTKSRNARSKQLLVMPTDSLTNREWIPGEFLSWSECWRPSWILDMNYQSR